MSWTQNSLNWSTSCSCLRQHCVLPRAFIFVSASLKKYLISHLLKLFFWCQLTIKARQLIKHRKVSCWPGVRPDPGPPRWQLAQITWSRTRRSCEWGRGLQLSPCRSKRRRSSFAQPRAALLACMTNIAWILSVSHHPGTRRPPCDRPLWRNSFRLARTGKAETNILSPTSWKQLGYHPKCVDSQACSPTGPWANSQWNLFGRTCLTTQMANAW